MMANEKIKTMLLLLGNQIVRDPPGYDLTVIFIVFAHGLNALFMIFVIHFTCFFKCRKMSTTRLKFTNL